MTFGDRAARGATPGRIVAGIGVLAVVCCAGLPVLIGVLGGLAIGELLGLGAGVVAVAVLLAAAFARLRRSRARPTGIPAPPRRRRMTVEPEVAGTPRQGDRHYDLAIVGSGGAAFAAAIAASDMGLRVVMVERGTVGGTCVNVGCIPSKALLAAAETRQRAAVARFPGIATDAGAVDVAALIAGKRQIVERLRREKYVDLAAEYGIELLAGDARFAEGPVLLVGERRIEAAHYLIASGAEPHVPDVPGLAASGYLTSATAMELDQLPASMLVIGGGYVALEQAQLFAHLGTRVTMLVRSSLARGEEPEIAAALRDALRAEGVAIHEGLVADEVRRVGDEVVLRAGATELRAEQILVAAGRVPSTSGLGLEHVGVPTGARGEVVVGDDLRTSNPRIWGAGDVTGHDQFVYVAARQGRLVVDNAFAGAGQTIDYRSLPRITFTSPAIASAGLTERQAREAGLDCESRVLQMSSVPRAIVSRDERGLVKLVAERATGRIVGVHLLAAGAGDAILAGVIAIDAGVTVARLAAGWNPYLTIGEAIQLAAQSFTRDPARLSCCAA